MHELISQRLGHPVDLLKGQRAYRDALKDQFGFKQKPRKKQSRFS
ncbi:hypothetical protein [Asaia platycodi]|nr:hypothetical protein [Asaia platycodi]